jgi:hypothetical protein
MKSSLPTGWVICWLACVFIGAVSSAPDGPAFSARLRAAKRPEEGADWKLFKDLTGKLSVLLPRGFIARSAPEDEKDVVLYCIAGGSLKEYRLAKMQADKDFKVSDITEEALATFSSDYLQNQIAKRLKDARLVERALVEIDGKKAFLIIAEGNTPGGFRSAIATVILRVDETTYQFSLSCLAENLDRFAESFAQILVSLRW